MAKILVIDDDPDVRATVAIILTAAEHEVVEAQDGREGLAQLDLHHPSLVVTDIFMPQTDGIEIIRHLRGAVPHIPILAISGGGRYEHSFLEVAKEFGATATLQKPFGAASLLGMINKLLM